MANLPFSITADSIEELRTQLFELIRTLYEDRVGGAEIGDVFTMGNDVLTLTLAGSTPGLEKDSGGLQIKIKSDGGLDVWSTGAGLKIVTTGGLETSSSGVGIKLDGTSLELSADGLKTADPLVLGVITLDNDGLHLLDTDDSHDLIISPGSDLSADRVLTITTGDAARTLNLVPDSGWAVTNAASDKQFDANTAGCSELADVLGTLITTLIGKGILAAP